MPGSSVVNLNDFNIALTRRVAELLYSHDPDAYGALDVVVQGNVAKLRGTVVGEERRARVVKLAKSVDGIRTVDDRLKVRPSRERKSAPTVDRPLHAPPAADPWWQRFAGPTYWIVAVAAILVWRFSPTPPEARRLEPLIPAEGALYVDGKPADGAELEFWPLHVADGRQPRPTALTDAQGRYRLTTDDADVGAPQGIYAVTVRWHPQVVRGEDFVRGDNVLPAKFASPHTTPLRVEIPSGRVSYRLPTLRLADCSGEAVKNR